MGGWLQPNNLFTLQQNNKYLTSFKEILTVNKPKNFIKFHYLNNYLSSPIKANIFKNGEVGEKLSLIKDKGKKNGIIINYNKFIGYNFIKNNFTNNFIYGLASLSGGSSSQPTNIFIKNTYKIKK